MTTSDKPTLTIVAGREGPTEGPHSNAARIADVAAKLGIQKRKRGRPRKPCPETLQDIGEDGSKGIPKSGADLHAQAFRDIEPEICDCVRMSYIAAQLVMNNDEAAPFAVGHLYEMLRRFKQEYYAAYHGDLAAIGRHAVIGDE
jgi:hypothetical protein